MRTFILKTGLSAVCLLYALNVAAQNKTIDSLKQVLQTQKADTNQVNTLLRTSAEFSQTKDNQNALRYANEALVLAQRINSAPKQASAYGRLGLIYFHDLKKYTQARTNFLQSNKIRAKLGDKKYLAYEYSLIAGTYVQQSNDPEALKYLYLFLKAAQQAGDREWEAQAFQEIGATFRAQEDNLEALKNYQESLTIRETIKNKVGMIQTLESMGDIYSSQGNHTKALQNALAALKIIKEPGFRGPDWLLPFTYTNLGTVYENRGDSAMKAGNKEMAAAKYQEALTNKLVALKLWRKLDADDAIAETYTSLGGIYRKQNQLLIAKYYLEKGLTESRKMGTVDNLQLTYNHLAKLDSIQGNYKQAYQHYKLYTLYRDSLTNEAKTKKLLQVKAQYESEKENALAKAEREKKDLVEQRTKNRQLYIIASLGLLVLVFVLIMFIQWRNNQQKQRTNVVLQQQKETIEQTLADLRNTQIQLVQKEKMASLGELTAGIAHEIQNPLNFVNNFADVSAEMVDELADEHQKPQRNTNLETELLTELKDNLLKINHHGQRAASIVRGMLEHSRNSTGEAQPTDLNALADEYLRLAYHSQRRSEGGVPAPAYRPSRTPGDPAQDKPDSAGIAPPDRPEQYRFNCELVTNFDVNIGQVNLVSQELGRVLLNLYTNAFYAVQERQKQAGAAYQPTITVSTSKTKNGVEIRVADNGTGMSESVKAKIFQPFFTTKPTGEGTGLGLSLSHDIIVKGHSGRLTVESQEGKGTEFTIVLPITEADAFVYH